MRQMCSSYIWTGEGAKVEKTQRVTAWGITILGRSSGLDSKGT